MLPAGLVLGRSSGRIGMALSRPVTPSTLPASDAGTRTGRSLARSGYRPALACAEARYSFSSVPNAASIFEVAAVART